MDACLSQNCILWGTLGIGDYSVYLDSKYDTDCTDAFKFMKWK